MSNNAQTTGKPLTPERIMQFAWGYSIPLMIEAGIKNRLFDTLDAGAMTLDQLAGKTGASKRGLRVLANALVGVELLRKEGTGDNARYALAPESAAFLVSTKPSFQGGLFRHISGELLPKWMKLEEIVRSGKPSKAVNQESSGGEFFEKFVEDIFPMSYQASQTAADALKLQQATQRVNVLDLAAGSGVWGIGLAQKSPYVHVTAVDWPKVISVTKRIAKRFEVDGRFRFVEGDLHQADFGTDHHVATLGHILHSEGEQRSRELLKKVHRALRPGGTIVIAEFTPNEQRTGPLNTLIFAVNMLVNTDTGDAFTYGEISSWLTQAGFKNIRQLEAPAPSPLILADKPM